MVYDLLITNVILVDGYWDFPYSGSVLIRDGVLEVVSACRVSLEARETFDGGGRHLIPGIVDVNSLYLPTGSEGGIGVTTRASLNPAEGMQSIWLQDYAALRQAMKENGKDGTAGGQEIRSRLSRSVSEGARGVSIDLSTFQVSSADEVFHALMEGIASQELVLLVHGSDDEHSLASLESVIASAHRTRTRVHVSCHRKRAGKDLLAETAISALIDHAAQAGLEISCDWYPHKWDSSSLPQTVKQVCSLPAQALGLETRGIIRSGYRADLVLLSPDEAHGPLIHRVWAGGTVVAEMR